jgi:hypothetical protein
MHHFDAEGWGFARFKKKKRVHDHGNSASASRSNAASRTAQ